MNGTATNVWRQVRLLIVPIAAIMASLGATALAIALFGADPVEVLTGMFRASFATSYGLSETLVKASPILLCALAVAVPAKVGLMNVGAEGQLYVGAACATGVALSFPDSWSFALLTLMFVAAFLGGAAWAGVAAVLRTRFNTSEIMVTLLGNFLAILLVQYLVFGPWKDPASRGWPQSAEFVPAAVLPGIGFGRVHVGLLIGLVVAAIVFVVCSKSFLGLRLRFIQSSRRTAEYAGIPVRDYLFWALLIGGGIAALAGAAEASAIQGRLRVELSAGYGYTGILVSWLARHNPLAIVFASFFIGGLLAGGDVLQVTMGLPAATVGIAVGTMLLFLLVGDAIVERRGSKP